MIAPSADQKNDKARAMLLIAACCVKHGYSGGQSRMCRDCVADLLASQDRAMEEAQREKSWQCKANKTADPPQDCNWPSCGCDPYADKVLAALEEAAPGLFQIERDNRELKAQLTAAQGEIARLKAERLLRDLCDTTLAKEDSTVECLSRQLAEAEAERARLREALTKIRDGYDYECQCEHDNEDCCAVMEDADPCAYCIASVALAIPARPTEEP